MELYLGDSFLTFDGAVVESFGKTDTANGRIHVGVVSRVEVGESRRGAYLLFHTIWGGGRILVPFPPEQRQSAEWFAAEVDKARAARPG